MNLYMSSASLNRETIRESVTELAEAGIKNIELSGGTKYYALHMEDVLELKEKYGLHYLVHNYFPPPEEDFFLNLISIDDKIKEKSFKLIREALDKVLVVGSRVYAFHPGYTVEITTKKNGLYFEYDTSNSGAKSEKESLFYERFEELLDWLPEKRTPLAVENLFPFDSSKDYSLMSHPDEIRRFLKKYSDDANVGMLLDLGHLGVAGNYLNFDTKDFARELMQQYSRKILEMHLSENDGSGDQHRMHEEGSWQIAIVSEFKEKMPEVPVTLEWHQEYVTDEMLSRYSYIAGAIA